MGHSLRSEQTGLLKKGWGSDDRVCYEDSNRDCGMRDRSRCCTHAPAVAQADPVRPYRLAALGAGLCDPAASSDPAMSSHCVRHPSRHQAQCETWTFPNHSESALVVRSSPIRIPGHETTVFTFTPLALVPGFLRPLFSWFTQNLNFEALRRGRQFEGRALRQP